jgi:TolB protein
MTGVRRRWPVWVVAVCLGWTVGLGPKPAVADVRLDITRGIVEPLPIAFLPFSGSGDEAQRLGTELRDVAAADLERSGLFRLVDPRLAGGTTPSIDELPRFAEWRQQSAQALVYGRASAQPDGRLKFEFRLWDVFAEQEMLGRAYTTQPNNWRRIAHIVADAIYKRLTGEDGYFDTKIAYVAESGPASKRIKRIAMMDQDGANNQFLTDGAFLVLTPRFSPSPSEIAFVRFADGQPKVMIRNLQNSRDQLVGDFPGMTFAPRFAPDGERLIMSMAFEGNSEIFTVDLRSGVKKRLTQHPAIDTSPCYSPDGRQVVFNSDRSGTQQLYVMDADGGNVRRISFGEGRYATPVWSPRGELIAFTKIEGGRFHIGVMRADSSGERLLAQGHRVEGPTWAPNGRVLMFFRQEPGGSRSQLFTIDVSGRNEREIPTPGNASDPSWSPLQP